METISTINQRAVYKYNSIVNIGAAPASKLYSFTLTSPLAWKLIWLMMSQNYQRGDALTWVVSIGNLKLDDVAMTVADTYIGINNFYDTINMIWSKMDFIPLEVYRKMFFNIKIENIDIVAHDSDMTLWFILMSNDHTSIDVNVTIA